VSQAASPTLDDWLTTEDVAEHYGVPVNKVLRMIREDRLEATKKGWVYLIHRTWLPEAWPPARAS